MNATDYKNNVVVNQSKKSIEKRHFCQIICDQVLKQILNAILGFTARDFLIMTDHFGSKMQRLITFQDTLAGQNNTAEYRDQFKLFNLSDYTLHNNHSTNSICCVK